MKCMKARILKAENLSPTAKLFSLEVLSGDFSFAPGQYMSFNVAGAIRTYSICSLPGQLPRFEFCVRQVAGGIGTGFLNAHVGKEIELMEPTGDFVLPTGAEASGPKSILFVVAGVGIAPVRPMLKDWLMKNPEARVKLAYKFHDESEYLFREELEQLAKEHLNFKLTTVHNPPQSPLILRGEEKWGSPSLKIREGRGELVFLVGSPPFVARTLQSLRQLGYNQENIKSDIWE